VCIAQEDIVFPEEWARMTLNALEQHGPKTVIIPNVVHNTPGTWRQHKQGPVTIKYPADWNVVSMWRNNYVPLDERYDQYLHWWGPGWSCDLKRAGMKFYCVGEVTHLDHPQSDMIHCKGPFGARLFRALTGEEG
jgi:hypothetical protein